MLGLFGKKSDHPMADIKSAQQHIEDIPKSDAFKALQELTVWIESVREQEDFRVDHQFTVLRMLDETARPFERKLTREYFAANAPSKFQENRLWMALNEFFTQLSQAYLTLLTRCRNGDKGASSIKAMLPLLSARGIFALTGKLKYAAARYMLVDPAIWRQLAEFYQFAEEKQYLDEPVSFHGGNGANTSVRREFASVLMWYASSASTLSRTYAHLAERLTSYLGGYLAVGVQHDPHSLFAFDLQQSMPPVRTAMEASQSPSMRYLGVKKIQPQVDSLLATLDKNIVPDEIGLGGLYDAGEVREVVRHLAGCWASPPPMRRNVRHNIKASLSVAIGFHGLLEQTNVGLNFSGSVAWSVEDISVSGFRTVLPATAAEGVGIGLLIGIKPERMESWGAGIVRRLSRDDQNNLHIGVEILSNQVAAVGVRMEHSSDEHIALWLDSSAKESGGASFLMRPNTYSAGRSLHMQFSDKSFLLLPLALVEKGVDYDLVRYRKVEEDTTPEESY